MILNVETNKRPRTLLPRLASNSTYQHHGSTTYSQGDPKVESPILPPIDTTRASKDSTDAYPPPAPPPH
ncbi:hypothetical protein P8452_59343 [Trifolium repens]|nr:hypothetical protein P8452_59343 [Trifolium repens]